MAASYFFHEKEVVRVCRWAGGSAWPLWGISGDAGLMQGWLNKRFQHGILGCETVAERRVRRGLSLALWARVNDAAGSIVI